jgi:hypothetical protein
MPNTEPIGYGLQTRDGHTTVFPYYDNAEVPGPENYWPDCRGAQVAADEVNANEIARLRGEVVRITSAARRFESVFGQDSNHPIERNEKTFEGYDFEPLNAPPAQKDEAGKPGEED